MKDSEISRKLALAIGWPQVFTSKYGVHVLQYDGWGWMDFDYRDWNVIGPIAERYDCFPYRTHRGKWDVSTCMKVLNVETPQKAIALAVIHEAVL